jgi:hypothetical protein
MATVLTVGDIAVVQYNSGTTDSFSFVFARDVEAGTVVNFTDNGWLAAGGFRLGEGTVTYTAPTAITGGTVITLTGLNLDDAGDQIIAYQGTEANPTILYLVDLADGNNTVAGDATNDNTTALPPGLTLGVNAVAVPFDNAIYAGPIDGSPPQLFPLISNSANWIDGNALPPSARYFYPPHLDLDSDNSTSGGDNYRAEVTSNGAPVPSFPVTCCRSPARCHSEFLHRLSIRPPASSSCSVMPRIPPIRPRSSRSGSSRTRRSA